MPRCTECGSYDCESNRISDETMKHALHAGHIAHQKGFNAGGLLGIAAVGVMKGYNTLTHQWRCKTCRHRFSEGA